MAGVGSPAGGAAESTAVEAVRFAIPLGASKSIAKPCASAEAARSVRMTFIFQDVFKRWESIPVPEWSLSNRIKSVQRKKGAEDLLRKKGTRRSVVVFDDSRPAALLPEQTVDVTSTL